MYILSYFPLFFPQFLVLFHLNPLSTKNICKNPNVNDETDDNDEYDEYDGIQGNELKACLTKLFTEMSERNG